MKYKDYNIQVFFNLLRAGLFPVHGEGNSDIRIDGTTDWNYIYQLAQEQSVQGIVLCGIEELRAKGLELSVPKVLLLQWIGEVQVIEQRNKEMNAFVANLIEKLRRNDIYAILVKGQGIAQCYEKPLWRACGDVDLLLNEDNYEKAKSFLVPLAASVDTEEEGPLHQAMIIDPWEVELHGTLHSGLYPQFDRMLDDIQKTVFEERRVRVWQNGTTDVFLPAVDEDIIFVFAHILQHFLKGGIGLRQICDWCRILWTYKASIDRDLLMCRLDSMGLFTEWKAFASLSVNVLGMPEDAMPFYSFSLKWHHKAEKILDFIIETGNFGHNRDNSYYEKKTLIGKKIYSFWRHTSDSIKHFFIFPLDSLRIWWNMVKTGLRAII